MSNSESTRFPTVVLVALVTSASLLSCVDDATDPGDDTTSTTTTATDTTLTTTTTTMTTSDTSTSSSMDTTTTTTTATTTGDTTGDTTGTTTSDTSSTTDTTSTTDDTTTTTTTTTTTDPNTSNGDGTDENTNTNTGGVEPTDAFPSGMAVASPTAERGGAGRGSRWTVSPPPPTTPSDYEGKKEYLQQILDATEIADCAADLPIATMAANVNCYGPGMSYAGHPDTVAPRYFSSASAPSSVLAWDGSLPTGDLGLWGSTENDQACAAAKLNQLVGDAANRVDTALYLGAITACVMKNSSTDLPEIGDDPLDLTDEVVDVMGMGRSGPFEITAVSIERMANDGGDMVLHYAFQLTDAMSNVVYDSDFYHHQDPDVASSYSGTISNTLQYMSADPVTTSAYSLQYRRNSSDIEARMLAANYQTAAADATIFDDAGIVDVAGTWSGSFSQTIYHVDADTQDVEVSYAWQAGTGDSHARVFNVYTRTDEDTEVRGCGWFGYGPRFDNGGMMSDPALSDNTIERFICNWAGPGNLHDDMSQVGRAQKQCMILNTGSGQFEIDQDGMMQDINFIRYAPTNSCDVGDPSDFDYNIAALAELVIDAQITNNLVTLSGDSDYDEWLMSLVPEWAD